MIVHMCFQYSISFIHSLQNFYICIPSGDRARLPYYRIDTRHFHSCPWSYDRKNIYINIYSSILFHAMLLKSQTFLLALSVFGACVTSVDATNFCVFNGCQHLPSICERPNHLCMPFHWWRKRELAPIADELIKREPHPSGMLYWYCESIRNWTKNLRVLRYDSYWAWSRSRYPDNVRTMWRIYAQCAGGHWDLVITKTVSSRSSVRHTKYVISSAEASEEQSINYS